jgi:hypothetical protein
LRIPNPDIDAQQLRIRGYNQNGVNDGQNHTSVSGQTQEGHALLQLDVSHANVPSASVGAASVLTNRVSNATSYLAVDAEL